MILITFFSMYSTEINFFDHCFSNVFAHFYTQFLTTFLLTSLTAFLTTIPHWLLILIINAVPFNFLSIFTHFSITILPTFSIIFLACSTPNFYQSLIFSTPFLPIFDLFFIRFSMSYLPMFHQFFSNPMRGSFSM